MLLLLVMLNIRHAHLGLTYTWDSLKGIAIRVYSFGCGFACATTMRCAGFQLLFGILFFFIIIDYYQIKTRN